jgi:hypothetical protein
LFIAGYFLLCILVAICGRNRRSGFVGTLFMCLFLTPVVIFLILWLTAPRADKVIVSRSRTA